MMNLLKCNIRFVQSMMKMKLQLGGQIICRLKDKVSFQPRLNVALNQVICMGPWIVIEVLEYLLAGLSRGLFKMQ